MKVNWILQKVWLNEVYSLSSRKLSPKFSAAFVLWWLQHDESQNSVDLKFIIHNVEKHRFSNKNGKINQTTKTEAQK